MELKERLVALKGLRQKIKSFSQEEKESLCIRCQNENAWFDEISVENSLRGICDLLEEKSLHEFASHYCNELNKSKRIGLVMAGNIPAVGFHDMLCVFLSGGIAVCKLSSDDTVLMKYLIHILASFSEEVSDYIKTVEQLKVDTLDAVIATGSDNTARYFEKYFSSVPNVIRKNRTSVAVLTGEESEDELEMLAKDVFTYYGLGCRNISKILAPDGYDFVPLLDAWQTNFDVIKHHKYSNNYDYNKSVYLVNKVKHLDTGFLLLTENEALVSPISVIYYTSYGSKDELDDYLTSNQSKIQCVVGKDSSYIPFGEAQKPKVSDFADSIDTMKFLNKI